MFKKDVRTGMKRLAKKSVVWEDGISFLMLLGVHTATFSVETAQQCVGGGDYMNIL